MRIMMILVIGIMIFALSCKSHSEDGANNQIEIENISEQPVYSSTNTQNNYSETSFDNNDAEVKDCFDAYSSADDAYTYCRRAYNSDDYDELKSYLKKAMSSFEDAMSNADDCGCEDAYSSADEGYTYARRGYNSDDFEEMKDYARKAKNSADDTMSNANDCSNN